jgi:hypothetical protein
MGLAVKASLSGPLEQRSGAWPSPLTVHYCTNFTRLFQFSFSTCPDLDHHVSPYPKV